MKEKKRKQFLALLVILCMTFSLFTVVSYAAEPSPPLEAGDMIQGNSLADDGIAETGISAKAMKSIDEVTEADVIPEESSESVTAFDLGNGQRAKIFYSYEVRYQDEDGEYVEYDPELTAITEKETAQGTELFGYEYENKQGKYKHYLPENLSADTPILMENGDYQISMAPIGNLSHEISASAGESSLQAEMVQTAANTNRSKKVKMIYGSERADSYVTYTSQNDSVKETIVLNKKPQSNVFTFQMTLKGLTYRMNPTDKGITLYDNESGDIVASVGAPFMNDATGDAYSDALFYTMTRKGNSDTYVLKLTVDQSYLNDNRRVYPVTIDPTIEWVGTSSVKDAYVLSGSANTNYYSNSTKVMPVGKGAEGKYRTYIKFLNLKSELRGATISSANFIVYETGNGGTSRVTRVHRITEDWSYSTITWNSVPTNNSAALASITSAGTTNKKQTFDLKNWVQGVVNNSSNFGIVLKNQVEASTSYVEFYGTRTGATSYRPKLTITYTADVPASATSITPNKTSYDVGESIRLSWTGITANYLNHVVYKIVKTDTNWENDTVYQDYATLTSSSTATSATLPITLPKGYYKIYLAGISEAGHRGEGRYCRIKVGYDIPTAPSMVAVSQAVYGIGEAVQVAWSGITASSLSKIQYRVASCDSEGNILNSNYVSYTDLNVTAASSGSATISDSLSWPDGHYIIYLRGKSTNGNTGNADGCYFDIDRTAPTADLVQGEGSYYFYVRWDNVSDDFAYMDFFIDESQYARSTATSGWQFFFFDNFTEDSYHYVYVDVVDATGNATRNTYAFYVPYQDYQAPDIGNTALSYQSASGAAETALNQSNWYLHNSGNLLVKLSDITDSGSGVNTSSLVCEIYKDNLNGTAIKTISNPIINGSSEYQAIFTIPLDSSFSDGGKYLFKVSVSDYSGNSCYDVLSYQKDVTAPTGSVSAKTEGGTTELTTLSDIVVFTAAVSDNESGIKEATLKLKNLSTNEESLLIHSFTIGTTARKDTSLYADGDYQLILTMKNGVDLVTTVSKNITIDNRIPAPNLATDVTGSNDATIAWSYPHQMDRLVGLKYSIDNGMTWHDVSIGENKRNGSFHVTLPAEISGTYPVLVRGVDTNGKDGKIKTISCIIDKTAPTVAISGLVRGLLSGSITDEHLENWQVSVKPQNAEESAYTQLFEGTDVIENGRIGIIDLSDTAYASDTWYTVKITATDIFGNTASATQDILKDSNYQTMTRLEPVFRIARSVNQDYQSNRFTVAASTATLSLNTELTGDIRWFVNNLQVSQSASYEDTFAAKYTEGVDYPIAVLHTGSDGSRNFSQAVIQNYNHYEVNWSEITASENAKEKTIAFDESVVSFVLAVPESSESLNYAVKVGGGSYQTVNAGSRIYLADLQESALTSQTLTLKVTAADADAFEDFGNTEIRVDLLENEFFRISQADNYAPKNVSAEEGLNNKTYIKWQNESNTTELPENVYYQVYRGTTAGFVPSLATLVGDDIKAQYWSEMNVNYSDTFYYKVRAVAKDAERNVISASSFSNEMSATVIDYDEYVKRLGKKTYWAYGELDMPNAELSVEKSMGNLFYSQTDGSITTQKLTVDLNRAYNSQATSKTAFGKGWTHSYDLELLSLMESDILAEGSIILKDGNGTLFFFEKQEDGSYLSSLGKFITLEKKEQTENISMLNAENETIEVEVSSSYVLTTKDKSECRFNSGGQLIYLKDANGNLVLVSYDIIYGTITKIVTGQNAAIQFHYNAQETGDPLLVHEVSLPDGQTLRYAYTNGRLTRVTEIGDAQDLTDDIIYTYHYNSEGLLNYLRDGKNNTYDINYDAYNRVTEITYPQTEDAQGQVHTEKVQFVYNTSGSENTQTITKKVIDGQTIANERDEFETSFGSRIRYTDAEGYQTEYTFKDNLPEETKYVIEYAELQDGTIAKKTTTKTEKNTYNEQTDVVQEKDTSGNYTYYEYLTESGKTHLVKSMTIVSADGITSEQEEYAYDDHDNVILIKDTVNHLVTRMTYSYVGAGKGEVASKYVYLLENGNEKLQTSLTKTYAYDTAGNLVETQTENADGATVVTVTTYDVAGKTLSTVYTYTNTDGSKNRKTLSNVFDAFGRVITQITEECDLSTAGMENTDTKITLTKTFDYDKNHNVISETDYDGTVHIYAYDAADNLIKETISGNGAAREITTQYAYEDVTVHTGIGSNQSTSNAYVITETLKEGNDTSILTKKYQDRLGRVVREIAQGVQIDYAYNAQNDIISIYKVGLLTNGTEDSDTVTHEIYLYNVDGKRTHQIQRPVYDADTDVFLVGEDTIVTMQTYDADGNVLTETDAQGQTTRYTYDQSGRLTSVTLPNGKTTGYTYDVFDQGTNATKTITTYANGQTSVTFENAVGKTIKVIDQGDETAADIVKSYSYDARNNLIKETYSKGNYKTYEYDARDRQISVSEYESTSGNIVRRTEYSYNTADLVTVMKDYTYESGSKALYRYTKYEYDAFKRLSGKAELNTASVPTATQIQAAMTSYEYNLNDQMVKVTYPNIGGETLGILLYTYDDRQHLTKVERQVGNTKTTLKTYAYLTDGKVNSIQENGITVSYTYDEFDRLLTKTYRIGNSVKESHTYTYRKDSKLVSETIVNNWPQSAAAKVNERRVYTYDAAGQLKETVITDLSTGSVKSETAYDYDVVGNRTSEAITDGENRTLTEYTYNGLNQLTTEKHFSGSTEQEQITYRYDANGNQIEKTEANADIRTIYAYDAADQMFKLERYEGNDETPTFAQSHAYNGKGQRIRKTEGTSVRNYFYEDESLSYTTDGSDNLKAFQLYDGNGDLFGTLRAGNLLYTYTSDLSGSITNVVDTDQSAVVSYTYNEFGETTETQGGAFDNEARFNGGIYDESTGLYYLNARFYDPAVGRFLNPDSFRGEAADPQSLHLYAYCANDPVNYVDPTGHWIETALDVASLAHSTYTFKKDPSLENFAYMALDTVAVAVPGVSGTWVLKALKAPKLKEVKAAGKLAKKVKWNAKRTYNGKRLANVKATKQTAKKEAAKKKVETKAGTKIAAVGTKTLIKQAQLPTTGKIRYIPPKVKAGGKLPMKDGGYVDKFGNVWVKGVSRTVGEVFEWDVQLSRKGAKQLGWASRDKKHLNVSLKGRVTHM